MEKRQGGNLRHGEEEAKSHVWDCDSSLYDSFELRSFKRQLDSAISSRTLSMPRLLEVQRPSPNPIKRRSSKITRSVQKLIRSVFGWKPSSGTVVGHDGWLENGLYVFPPRCLGEGGLPKIPEVHEGGIDSGRVSPDFGPIVRRSASERTGFVFHSSVKQWRPLAQSPTAAAATPLLLRRAEAGIPATFLHGEVGLSRTQNRPLPAVFFLDFSLITVVNTQQQYAGDEKTGSPSSPSTASAVSDQPAVAHWKNLISFPVMRRTVMAPLISGDPLKTSSLPTEQNRDGRRRGSAWHRRQQSSSSPIMTHLLMNRSPFARSKTKSQS
ncbi:hypothetical protein MRB53_002445 [Persea americana]|uniref:Uncharacterized protein n=1 Tax=Persea americana TaxID=3435 RepID=A0ACC2MUD5_PERAE|nr:hypothetical protein MRB53_002445 [Persea americana]